MLEKKVNNQFFCFIALIRDGKEVKSSLSDLFDLTTQSCAFLSFQLSTSVEYYFYSDKKLSESLRKYCDWVHSTQLTHIYKKSSHSEASKSKSETWLPVQKIRNSKYIKYK